MKIKVIDLLVEIANRDESTKVKTKYDSVVWDKDDFLLSIYNEFGNRNNEKIVEFLNDEVEIIDDEEPKKIEKIDFGTLNTQKEKDRAMKDTINKLIDEINNLKEK